MKILRWLDEYFEDYLMVAILFAIFFLVCLQVFTRYVLEDSLTWTEEAVRYLFIWMVFIGFSMGVKKKNHISIFFLYNAVSKRKKILLRLFSNAMFLLFCIVIGVLGIKELVRFLEFSQISPALELPMYWVYASAPVGLGLTTFRLIQNTVRMVGGKNMDEESQSPVN